VHQLTPCHRTASQCVAHKRGQVEEAGRSGVDEHGQAEIDATAWHALGFDAHINCRLVPDPHFVKKWRRTSRQMAEAR